MTHTTTYPERFEFTENPDLAQILKIRNDRLLNSKPMKRLPPEHTFTEWAYHSGMHRAPNTRIRRAIQRAGLWTWETDPEVVRLQAQHDERYEVFHERLMAYEDLRKAYIQAKECMGNWQRFTDWSGWDAPEGEDGSLWTFTTILNRDSALIEQANAHSFHEELDQYAEAEQPTVVFANYGHWACGWVEHCIVKVIESKDNPVYTEAYKKLREMIDFIEAYPILDEDYLSQLESEAEWEALEQDMRYLDDEVKELFDALDGTSDDPESNPDDVRLSKLMCWLNDEGEGADGETERGVNYYTEGKIIRGVKALYAREHAEVNHASDPG
jgi:hypothetical protein